MTPLKAIRAFCTECMGGVRKDVKTCNAPMCPLYPFRMGKLPKSGTVTPRKVPTCKKCGRPHWAIIPCGKESS